MDEDLTKRQQQVLAFIRTRQAAQGLPPTTREIAAHFGFSSPTAAADHVKALLNKGVLKNVPGRARSLLVTEDEARREQLRSRVVSVPLYGEIHAGLPTDATQEDEACVLVDVDTLGIKPTARTFGLKVRGDSMVGKHIINGDIAIIEHGVQPRSGDVVAALIDGQVTLKTFVMQRGKPFLRAENPRYPDLIPQEELQIQGVLMALIRKRKG